MRRFLAFSVLSIAAIVFAAASLSAQFSAGAISGQIGSTSGGTATKKMSKIPIGQRKQSVDLITVEIIDAFVDRVHEIESLGNHEAKSAKQYAQLKIKVTNNSKKETVPYYSWAFFSAFPFSVKDEDQNPITLWKPRKLQPNGAFTYPSGGVKVGGYLKAKSNIIDILIFETPKKLDQDITVELPGRNIGAADSIIFKVPAKIFEK